MKKILTFTLLSVLILSCNKRNSELEIIENNPEVTTKIHTMNISTKKTKPLIKISKYDTLKIMVRADGAPGMFLNEKKDLEGFYIELEKAVMDKMQQKYELIPYSDLGPLVQNIKTGTVHSALATPLLPDFQSFLNISNPFEILNFVIFFPESSKEAVIESKEDAIKALYNKRVGVQTRGHIYQILRDHKDIEIIEYPTTTVAMEALNNGEVDAVPEVRRVGIYYSKLNNWNVKPVGVPILNLKIGTGFSKALDPSIVNRYNTALQSLIDSGYIKLLYQNYFGQ